MRGHKKSSQILNFDPSDMQNGGKICLSRDRKFNKNCFREDNAWGDFDIIWYNFDIIQIQNLPMAYKILHDLASAFLPPLCLIHGAAFFSFTAKFNAALSYLCQGHFLMPCPSPLYQLSPSWLLLSIEVLYAVMLTVRKW